jgi:hypothetical protein
LRLAQWCFGWTGSRWSSINTAARVKKINLFRFAHQSDVNHIIVLLSLGLLVLWTIGPFTVFIVYHVPRLRRFLGLDDSIK